MRDLARRRELPLAVVTVAAVLVLVLRGTSLLVLLGLLQVAALALVLLVWQRLAAIARGHRVTQARVEAVAHTLGDPQVVLERVQAIEARQDEAIASLDALDVAEDKRATLARFERRRDYAQVEALMNLYAQFPPTARMPPLRVWGISPDLLLALVEVLRQRRPRVVVELGGGSSTVWLAHVLRSLGDPVHFVTLEHDEHWARKVRGMLAAQGLSDWADVRLAPLQPQRIGEEDWSWYAPQGWTDLQDIDVLLVDGPPAGTARMARYPAVPLLGDRLGENAVVLMDDGARADEKRTAERWSAERPGFSRLDLPVEKRAIILWRGGPLAL